ncbi:MAG: sigma-54 dependent transcriptional regulator [Woeseia sp.]
MFNPGVLIVEDDANLREALRETLGESEYPVFAADSGAAALSILKREPVGLVVTDLQMSPMNGHDLLAEIRRRHPEMPAVLMTAYGTIENAVDVMRNGAADYLVKPFAASALLEIVERFLKATPDVNRTVAADPKTRDLLRIAERVAASSATVMISGESGCGKEVFARFIHEKSTRSDMPFVAINCAAIPENMLEAVLFGYEKGAFTGAATAHAGKFEQANGGTLLLDEISEMEPGLQAKLLRVLQEREVERIGGSKAIPLNVRVLATTNRDLRQCVRETKFREDLYYRLNVFPLFIPPLRERTGDILPLANKSIACHAERGASPTPVLADCAGEKLLAHAWPGNVRELENLIQRTLILFQGDILTAGDLVFEDTSEFVAAPAQADNVLQDDLRQREYRVIADALQADGGNRSAVASKLGISPRTLRYKLARMRDDGVCFPESSAAACAAKP